MTDFSTRIRGVISDNTAVFSMASSVYSQEGLIKYASWYSIFGTFALIAIVLVYIATLLDFPLRTLYVDILMKNKKFKTILDRTPYTPIYKYNTYSSAKLYKPLDVVASPVKPRFNPCQRVCLQHSYFQALLRFDPRLSRSFRMLFLILIQFHSLFVTAFLYGFSSGVQAMGTSDMILLSLLTSLVTIPCVRIGLFLLNRVGLIEFQSQFPLLYDEYMRRVEFEEIAEPLFEGITTTVEAVSSTQLDLEEKFEESVVDRIVGWITWRKETVVEKKDRPTILRELAASIRKTYPKFRTYSLLWELLPCHTLAGWLFLFSSFAWIGWCLNYLLLFAASHTMAVGNGILISYGSTELITIFLTQPLAIICTTAFFILGHKYKDKLPWPLNTTVSTTHTIPSVYYFSNPLHTYTILSSEFAHLLFLDAPAQASGVDILSTAPIKSILTTINEEEEKEDRRIEDLYVTMTKYYTEALV